MLSGIDLGDGNTRISGLDNAGNPTPISSLTGALQIPSCVYFNDDKPVVGDEALNLGRADPRNFVANWKRHLGGDKVLHKSASGQEYRAEDVARILLEQDLETIRAKTGSTPECTCISVPANFPDNKKALILDAAKKAGFSEVILSAEPTAALLGNKVHERAEGIYLVMDPGSSTFDATVAQKSGNLIEVKFTDGEANLGGQDYTAQVLEIGLAKFQGKHAFRPAPQDDPVAWQDLIFRAEQAKITLSIKDQAGFFITAKGKSLNAGITRAEYEAATADLTQKMIDCALRACKGAGVEPKDIKEIFLVGGPSKTPAIIHAIEKAFGRPPSQFCEPHHATSLGNVVFARLHMEEQGRTVKVDKYELPPLSLAAHEITAHAFGVKTLKNKATLVNAVILPKGTPIPSTQVRKFKLVEEGQTEVRIEVLQGPDDTPHDQCLLLGHFELNGMTAVYDRDHTIEVRLHLDRNGMLTATAYDPLSGVKADLVIDYKNPPAQSAAA